jgi:hypothetical protein
MIIFSVGLIIGGFLGITFMAVFFIGKKEDARRHELHDNFEINQYKQKQPTSVYKWNYSLKEQQE